MIRLWAIKPARRLVRVYLTNGTLVMHMPDLSAQKHISKLLSLIKEHAPPGVEYEVVDRDTHVPLHTTLCRVRMLLKKPEWIVRVKMCDPTLRIVP
jgi:hypothetical protein